MATMGNNNMQAKLVLLGDMGAGKSSLVLRFVKGQFFDYQESTIGAAFFSQTLAVNETTVKFEIWDTAGQERYHSLAPMYYRGAAAAIIVYDVTNSDSFTRAKNWVQELLKQGNPNLVMALAGNKSDMTAKRKVEPESLSPLLQSIVRPEPALHITSTAKLSIQINKVHRLWRLYCEQLMYIYLKYCDCSRQITSSFGGNNSEIIVEITVLQTASMIL